MAERRPLPLPQKVGLLARIWMSYVRTLLMARHPLPDQVTRIQARPRDLARTVSPQRLARAIHRGLRLGPLAPRCLPKALVMFEILHRQGIAPELVIGLPQEARNHRAHAWVEIDSLDVGPPPGRAGHAEMARYG